MNTQKLNSAITEFTKKKKSNAAYYEANWAERKERKDYYQSFTNGKLTMSVTPRKAHQANIGQLYSLTVSV